MNKESAVACLYIRKPWFFFESKRKKQDSREDFRENKAFLFSTRQVEVRYWKTTDFVFVSYVSSSR